MNEDLRNPQYSSRQLRLRRWLLVVLPSVGVATAVLMGVAHRFLSETVVVALREDSDGTARVRDGSQADVLTQHDPLLASTEDAGSAIAGQTSHEVEPGPVTMGSASLLLERKPIQQALALAASAEMLPSERLVVNSTALSLRGVTQALGVDGFGDFLNRMHGESARDPLSGELTRTYREALDHQITASGDRLSLGNFVCGLRICVGEFGPGITEADLSAWRGALATNTRAPHTAFIGAPLSGVDGIRGYRFVFSTDPSVTGITGPYSP